LNESGSRVQNVKIRGHVQLTVLEGAKEGEARAHHLWFSQNPRAVSPQILWDQNSDEAAGIKEVQPLNNPFGPKVKYVF